MNPTSRPERVPALDLLRFMAAVGVMLYHYVSHRPQADGSLSFMATITQQGYLGVDVFFMISGFVILWSATGRSATAFARARILRLYPEFWLAMLVTSLAIACGAFAGRHVDLVQLLGNATMIPQYLRVEMIDGVYWTLAVEIKFYALVWLLIVLRQIPRLEILLYVWLGLTAIAVAFDVGTIVRSAILFPYGAHFAAGGLFYLVYESGWTRGRTAALAAAVPLCAISSISEIGEFVDVARITAAVKVATAAVIGAAFTCFALLRRLQAIRWPAGIAILGALTYPLYLTHNVGKAIFLQKMAAGPAWARTLLAIGFSLLLAWVVMWTAKRFIAPALKRVLNVVRLRDQPMAKPAALEGAR